MRSTTPYGYPWLKRSASVDLSFGSECGPLFVNPCGRRLSVIEIGSGLKHELGEAGIDLQSPVTTGLLPFCCVALNSRKTFPRIHPFIAVVYSARRGLLRALRTRSQF